MRFNWRNAVVQFVAMIAWGAIASQIVGGNHALTAIGACWLTSVMIALGFSYFEREMT